MGIEVIYPVGAALLLLALIWELTDIVTVVRESAKRATLQRNAFTSRAENRSPSATVRQAPP